MYHVTLTGPARVLVDPNGTSRMDPDLIVTRRQDADRKVEPGEYVIAIEPDADGPDLVGSAVVSHVDDEHGLIYLHVDWASFAEDPCETFEVPIYAGNFSIITRGTVRGCFTAVSNSLGPTGPAVVPAALAAIPA